MPTRIAHVSFVHGPGPRQSMVDHGDFIVNNPGVGFVAVYPFLENGLIVEVEGKAAGIVDARTLEAARFGLQHIIVAVAILVYPPANRIARVARLDLLGPVAAVGEDPEPVCGSKYKWYPA